MKPSVFLNPEFLRVLDDFEPSKDRFNINVKEENKNQLIEIIRESNIETDLSPKEIIRLSKKLRNNYNVSSWFEHTFQAALRNNRLSHGELNFSNSKKLYLLNKNSFEILKLQEEHNIICEGIDFDFTSSISPRAKASVSIDKEMNGIEVVRHRCRNVIIIEPYLFSPIGSKDKNVPKIPNVVTLLKNLFFSNNIPQLQLTILYSRESELSKDNILSKINELESSLGSNVNITAYGHKKNLFQGNRYVLTDYSIMDLQHLFDRDDASVSINFLYDRDINQNFDRVRKLLQLAIQSYKSDPTSFALQQVKFGNILENELFSNIEI